MTYHLHTENCPGLSGLVADFFPDFTLIRGRGYWHGSSESSVIIEITSEGLDGYDQISKLAEAIKIRNTQHAVLIEAFNGRGRLA